MSYSNFKDLECAQAQALHFSIGLPKCTSTFGTLAEARVTSPVFMVMQGIFCAHLSHQYTAAIFITLRTLSQIAVLLRFRDLWLCWETSSLQPAHLPPTPPWKLSHVPLVLFITGITYKSGMSLLVPCELALADMYSIYALQTHIHEDESSSRHPVSFSVYMPSFHVVLKLKLGHMTSSTAAEIGGIGEALSNILKRTPQASTIFVDFTSALQALSKPHSCSVSWKPMVVAQLGHYPALHRNYHIVPQ